MKNATDGPSFEFGNPGEPANPVAWNDEAALSLRILATSPDCIKIMDLHGGLLFMNQSGQCLMEIDDFESMRGVSWPACWPEPLRPQLAAAMEKARVGEVARFSGQCPTAKGTVKWWDVVVSPFRDGSGHVSSILAVSRDVTAQKETERRLIESEQRFRALADNMAQLSWIADHAGSIFWFNRRWFEFTGTTPDDMKNGGWQSVHHPDHLKRVTKKIAACFSSGTAWEDTFPLKGANGEYRWFLSRAMPTLDEHGKITLWCGTNTDITDQRNAGARLRQMARLIELSHEAILVWDLDRGIVLWNEGCEALYGYSRVEAVGSRSHDLLKTTHPMATAAFESLLRHEGEWTGELLHIAKDGSRVWVDSRQELIRFGDRYVVLETNRDITERRKADETRNILVAELNHRVKNTLAIVQSIAGQTARSQSDPREFATAFNDRLQALAGAHNVLTDGEWVGAELAAIIDRQLADLPHVKSRFDVRGPAVFVGAQSALQVSMILHELVSNAIRHGALSSIGGTVRLRWRVELNEPARLHMTWLEEDGPVVKQPTRKGFGLTLIERTGSQHNLKAEVKFNPEGAVGKIVVDLPASPVNHRAYFNPAADAGTQLTDGLNDDRAPSHTRSRSQRVLIIEDEPIIAMEIEGLLADAGYVPVGPVSSVDAALKAIAEQKFDAAIVDGNLFGEPVEVIVDELERRKIPYAFASGGDIPTGSSSVTVPFISKPIRSSELLDALREIVALRAVP